MYDRPTADELIDAALAHFEAQVIPAIRADRRLYFQTLVAVNVLKIVQREMQHARDHQQAEWLRLNALLNSSEPLPSDAHAAAAQLTQRTGDLCASIRRGDYDGGGERQAALFAHLLAATVEQLAVANPRYLQTLAAEDNLQ